jgi:hypothetical protein
MTEINAFKLVISHGRSTVQLIKMHKQNEEAMRLQEALDVVEKFVRKQYGITGKV